MKSNLIDESDCYTMFVFIEQRIIPIAYQICFLYEKMLCKNCF